MKALLMVGLLIGTVVLNAVTLFLLWGWIVTPVFSLAPLTIGQAYGVSVVVSFFLAGLAREEADPVTSFSNLLIILISRFVARSVTFWLLGFVASLLV